MAKVIGIGLASLDYLLQVPDLRTVHRGCRLQDFRMQGGGPTATGMVAVAWLGGQAELWTVVGQHRHGRLIEGELDRDGSGVHSHDRSQRGAGRRDVRLCWLQSRWPRGSAGRN
jgi:sugar/nucleoside kinase (ribokinase family)